MPAETPTDAAEVPESYVTIPEVNLYALEDRLVKLNRRAKKLGLALIEPVEISREIRQEYIGTNIKGEPVCRPHVWITLDVQGDKPTMPGWTLIGAIDHGDQTDGSMNILRAPRGEEVPESFRKARPHCDHCGTTRRRRDTFILRTGGSTYMQIGRNCLQDFLGSKTTAAEIVGWFSLVTATAEACKEFEDDPMYEGNGNFSSDYVRTSHYLAAVAAEVRVYGWVSKGASYEGGGMPSATNAWTVLNPPSSPLPGARPVPEIMSDDVEIAEKALAWIRDLPEYERSNGYLANLYASCARDSFRTKQAGLAASLVGAAYPRVLRDAEKIRKEAEEKAARKANTATKGASTYIGQIKERLRDLSVTIEKVRGWEGDWGYTTLVAMRDGSNNLLIWRASGDKHDDLPKEGAACTLTGTVKAHTVDKYTGEDCTTLNRCKIAAV